MDNWLVERIAFVPDTLRYGRFPSKNELREAIQRLGFRLEEHGDWDVFSDNDFTQVWFKDDPGQPDEFWCRRGSIIVLDIVQSFANQCGSFFVVHSSDDFPVVIVPEDTFPDVPPVAKQQGYFAMIAHRAPLQIRYLTAASTDDILLVLSQFQHALRKAYQPDQRRELLEALRPGLAQYSAFLTHSDTRVRHLALEIVTIFRNGADIGH